MAVALNEALREAGRDERFHALAAEGQDLDFLLVTPEAARVARKELFVPIDKPAQARRSRRRRPEG